MTTRHALRTAAAREAHDEAVSQRLCAQRRVRWEEARLAALTEVAKWPGGIMPLAGLTVNMLHAYPVFTHEHQI